MAVRLVAALAIGAGLSGPAEAQRVDEIWVLGIERGAATLDFGGRSDPGSRRLGYVVQSFACRAGGPATLQITEGMPSGWRPGRRQVTVETATGDFALQADVLVNEEAGSPGLSVAMSLEQMRAVLQSPGQVHLRSGSDRRRVGLRGVEPHREAFLKACG
jgi:hypothetical protein